MQYFNDESFYESINENKELLKILNDGIIKLVLPNLKTILNDQDPMPLYGLKLLNILVDKTPVFVPYLIKFSYFDELMDYYNCK